MYIIEMDLEKLQNHITHRHFSQALVKQKIFSLKKEKIWPILIDLLKKEKKDQSQDKKYFKQQIMISSIQETTTSLLNFCTSWFLSRIQLLGIVLHIPPLHYGVLLPQIGYQDWIGWPQSPLTLYLHTKQKIKINICVGHSRVCEKTTPSISSTNSSITFSFIFYFDSQFYCRVKKLRNFCKVLFHKSPGSKSRSP